MMTGTDRWARRPRVWVVVALLTVALVSAPAAAGTPPGAAGSPLRLGSVSLHRCPRIADAWCGSRREPLDPRDPAGAMIQVGFVWYPATGPGAASGTIVAEEGGPGWPSSGSSFEYRAAFAPLLLTRNLLLVDSRGTGRSTLIDCPGLQRYQGSTAGRSFQRMVGRCGRRLNHRWRNSDGGWVHASDLFSTAYAVRDLADILRALTVTPVDLYGDSYGTWFAQSFLSRHPEMLRSVVLDSAYPMFGGSAWYPSSAWAARAAMRFVCERDEACRTQAPGDPWKRLGRVLRQVRAQPIRGMTRDPNGRPMQETVTPRVLVNLTANAGFDPIGYRELDAAVRAALSGGGAPILRMAAMADRYDNSTPRSARAYSDGMYFAVSCAEYDQLFNLQDPPAQRRRELAASIRIESPQTFRPFTPGEWVQMNAYSEAYTACLAWPKPDPSLKRKAPAHVPPLAPPNLPVLLVSGDLDSWTSSVFGPKVVRQVGPSARFVLLANSVHTAALGDTPSYASTACAASIVQRFIRRPDRLMTMRTSCAGSIPPIHTPGSFPKRLVDARAAAVVAGRATLLQRRAATVAAQTLGDTLMHWYVDAHRGGVGLYGGRWSGAGSSTVRFRLDRVEWVRGVRVSGSGAWHTATGKVTGDLVLRSLGGLVQRYRVAWNQDSPKATAWAVGGGLQTVFRLPAP